MQVFCRGVERQSAFSMLHSTMINDQKHGTRVALMYNYIMLLEHRASIGTPHLKQSNSQKCIQMHIIACRNIVPVCNSVYLTHPLQKAILEAAGHSISLSLNTATTEDRKLSLYCTNTGERESK